MKISAKCEYGIRLMLELALSHGTAPLTLKQIATGRGISEKYLGQIIIPLRNAGLVTASRGARGGYFLTGPPETITLAEIIEALGEQFTLPASSAAAESGPGADINPLPGVWRDLKHTIDHFLSEISLSTLVDAYRRNEGRHAFTYVI